MINPSPFVSDWETENSMAILTIINSNRTIDVKVQVRLNKDGQLASSVLRGKITRISGPAEPDELPVTTIFRSNQIAKWSNLKFTGGIRESITRTGRLPEGNYEACVDIVQINLQEGEIPSQLTLCSRFYIIPLPQPPVLIQPQDNSEIDKNNLFFHWAPVIGIDVVKYKVKIVEVFEKQSPEQAISSNLTFYRTKLRSTNFIYPFSAPQFIDGRKYAWQVQAVGKNDRLVASNDGKSEIASFKFKVE